MLSAAVDAVASVVENVAAEMELTADKIRVESNSVLGMHMRIPVTQQRKLYVGTDGSSSGKKLKGGSSKARGKGVPKAKAGSADANTLRTGYTLLSAQRDGVHFVTD